MKRQTTTDSSPTVITKKRREKKTMDCFSYDDELEARRERLEYGDFREEADEDFLYEQEKDRRLEK